jgi:hypothetical protein
MTRQTKTKSWPESSQKELLRAVFLSGDEGLSAFESWKAQIDMADHPDLGSFRLLPLLFHHLNTQGIDDPLMMKLKGIARRNWYLNQRFFHSVTAPLQALNEALIKCMLLYEPALALHYESKYALRSEIDLPVLIPFEQVRQAMKQLQDMGWRPVKQIPDALLERYLAATWRHLFQDAAGRRIHLHWQFLPARRTAEFEADLWESAVRTNLHDVPVHILNPADQLLHSCVAQDSLVPRSNFLRAIDATIIIRATPDLDWNRLLVQAKKQRLAVPLSAVLGYLQAALNQPLPPAFWNRLQFLPVSRQERLEHRLKNSRSQVWRRSWQLGFDYRRQSATGSLMKDAIGFPRHLQHYWRLSHIRQVPARAISVLRRRLLQPIEYG